MNKKSNYFFNSIIIFGILYTFYKFILWRFNVEGMITQCSATIVSKTMAVSQLQEKLLEIRQQNEELKQQYLELKNEQNH